jgi:hypothetical protein
VRYDRNSVGALDKICRHHHQSDGGCEQVFLEHVKTPPLLNPELFLIAEKMGPHHDQFCGFYDQVTNAGMRLGKSNGGSHVTAFAKAFVWAGVTVVVVIVAALVALGAFRRTPNMPGNYWAA